MQPGQTISPGDPPQAATESQNLPPDSQAQQAPVTQDTPVQQLSIQSEPLLAEPTGVIEAINTTTTIEQTDRNQQAETSQATSNDIPEPVDMDKSSQPEAQNNWSYSDSDAVESENIPQAVSVSWTASEYMSHDKNASWFGGVIAASILIAVIVYFITKDFVSPIVMVVFGIAFAAFGARKPQVLDYSINRQGITIGPKHYPFTMFRTYSVIEEEAVRSILLMPLQRFNLPISMYFDPADEQQIISSLSVYLPFEERNPSPIDNLMRRIRF